MKSVTDRDLILLTLSPELFGDLDSTDENLDIRDYPGGKIVSILVEILTKKRLTHFSQEDEIKTLMHFFISIHF